MDTDTTPTVQMNLFDEIYACDHCDVEAAAQRAGALPDGWKVVGRGFACIRGKGAHCEPVEIHYCAECVARTS